MSESTASIPDFYFKTMLQLLHAHEWKALSYILYRTYETKPRAPITWDELLRNAGIGRGRLNGALHDLIYFDILVQPGFPYPSDTYVLQNPSFFQMEKLTERRKRDLELQDAQMTEQGKRQRKQFAAGGRGR